MTNITTDDIHAAIADDIANICKKSKLFHTVLRHKNEIRLYSTDPDSPNTKHHHRITTMTTPNFDSIKIWHNTDPWYYRTIATTQYSYETIEQATNILLIRFHNLNPFNNSNTPHNSNTEKNNEQNHKMG